jgi:Xaa-Pro aminopeptidase
MDALVTEIVAGFRLSRARSGKGPTDVRDPASVLDPMRRVKEPVELERIRRAAKVSAAAHRAAMAATRPGVGEWELEAVVDSAFRAADPYAAPAFATIVGSGTNATTLHHVTNDRRIGEGDLVLVDAGAEIAMYCADITRTFPASGRFTPGQRALYDVVLAAEEAAIAAARVGAPVSELHDATLRALVGGMVELGLLRGEVEGIIEREEHKRFYMHQTSHWIGLDVHDAGPYRGYDGAWVPLEPGMVLTIEPGLYVPGDAVEVPEEFRGLGVRIEDDVIVTAGGPEVITRGVPVDPAEVEALVGSG